MVVQGFENQDLTQSDLNSKWRVYSCKSISCEPHLGVVRSYYEVHMKWTSNAQPLMGGELSGN